MIWYHVCIIATSFPVTKRNKFWLALSENVIFDVYHWTAPYIVLDACFDAPGMGTILGKIF